MNRELSRASVRATGSMIIVGSTPNLKSTTHRPNKDWDASVVGYHLDAGHKNLGEWANHIASDGSGNCGCHFHTDLLSSLPDEIILSIFTFLDISDLHALTKTSYRLRNISVDPLLHRNRLLATKSFLSYVLPRRPPLEALLSPRRIYLSRRDMTSRELSKKLLRINLNKKLKQRPDPAILVQRGVLPREYLRRWVSTDCQGKSYKSGRGYSRTTTPHHRDQNQIEGNSKITFKTQYSPSISPCPSTSKSPTNTGAGANSSVYYTHLSPTILSTCLTLEKRLVRDRLESFVRHTMPASQERLAASQTQYTPPSHTPTNPTMADSAGDHSPLRRPSVRYLTRRFSLRSTVDQSEFVERESRWGKGAERRRRKKWERRERLGEEVEGAGRAMVGRLRRFWEGVGKVESQGRICL